MNTTALHFLADIEARRDALADDISALKREQESYAEARAAAVAGMEAV